MRYAAGLGHRWGRDWGTDWGSDWGSDWGTGALSPYSRVGKAFPALGLVNFRCKVVSTSLTLSSYQVL